MRLGVGVVPETQRVDSLDLAGVEDRRIQYLISRKGANRYHGVIFQSYFQASSMPKRLLQYALSRLDILETSALDLDKLDIAWGKNSEFVFRDVGLKLRVGP